MRRVSLLLLLLVACKDTDKAKPTTQPASGSGSTSGSGSSVAAAAQPITPPTGALPTLTWKDTDDELLLASDGKTLTGPCGMTGTLTPTEVAIGGSKPEPWNQILRTGTTYSMAKLDWTITASASGEVTLNQHGDKKPLGTVTGLTDEAAPWFAAFIVAAPMVQHRITWQASDGKSKLELGGSADLRSWQISDGTTKLASRERNDPAPLAAGDAPAWSPQNVDVKADAPKQWIVYVRRTDAATKAAFAADQYKIVETEDGALTMDGKPLGRLVGRAACRAHDQAIPALVWTLFATKAGHAKVFGS